MRVLFFERSPIWLNGLPHGFRDAGHTIRASGPLTEQNIPRLIEEFHPDLIVTMGWGPDHTKVKQDWIRKHVQTAGIPHIYWAVEDPHFTKTFTLPLLMRMKPDFVFTLSKELVEFYRKLGIPAAHLDFGYHSSVHRAVNPLDEYKSSIAVIANAYPDILTASPGHYRNHSLRTLIVPLLQHHFKIDFWGRNWSEMQTIVGHPIPSEWIHGHLAYTEAYKAYSSVDIVLGLQNYTTQVTQRTYEILASGGFLLTSDTPAVRSLFTPGRDLVVSSSADETIQLTRYYLQHPEEREFIRRNGRLAVGNHSYKHRAEYIIQVLRQEGILRS